MLDKPTVIRYYSTPYPGNSWLQIATYGDTQYITGSHYCQKELGIFIPAGWIIHRPDIIADMELTGLLGGRKKNRVKVTAFKGIRSDGIFYGKEVDGKISPNWDDSWEEGESDRVIEAWKLEKFINPEAEREESNIE